MAFFVQESQQEIVMTLWSIAKAFAVFPECNPEEGILTIVVFECRLVNNSKYLQETERWVGGAYASW